MFLRLSTLVGTRPGHVSDNTECFETPIIDLEIRDLLYLLIIISHFSLNERTLDVLLCSSGLSRRLRT